MALTLSPSAGQLVVELLGLHLADRGVERGHDTDKRRLTFQVGGRDRDQRALSKLCSLKSGAF